MDKFTKYHALYGEDFLKELELEAIAKQEAGEHLRNVLAKVNEEGEGGQGHLSSKFIQYVWDTCYENIAAIIKQVKENNTRGVKSKWVFVMEDLLKIYVNQEDELTKLLV